MGSKGDCYDNAVAESFFATLKKELIHGQSWPTQAELRHSGLRVHRGLLQPPRRHSTLGNALASEYEKITRPPQTRTNKTKPPVSTEAGELQSSYTIRFAAELLEAANADEAAQSFVRTTRAKLLLPEPAAARPSAEMFERRYAHFAPSYDWLDT